MSGTKSFPADNVKLHIASAADAPTGTMTVLMRTNRYYTDGSLLQTGEQYTVTKEWGQDALSRNWCEDVADVFPETETPSGLTADEVSLIRGVVSQAGISGATYDGSGRLTGYTRQGVAHTVSYPSSTTVVVSNTTGAEREVTLDGSGRVQAIA